MNKSEKKIAQTAALFAKRWEGKGEKDRAVMTAYAFPTTMPESDIVA